MVMTSLIRVRAPANIALLKYWGKRDEKKQWPANNSLSMTLSRCVTETQARLFPSTAEDHHLIFAGKPLSRQDELGRKAFLQLDRLQQLLGHDRKLAISTQNHFPTACGIASSASGLSALTLAAIAAWTSSSSFTALAEKGFDRQRLAELARLGSGSACRSLWGGFVLWEAGQTPEEQKLRQIFSPDHWPLEDTVVLLSRSVKAEPSSQAHARAWSSPLFKLRLAGLQAKERELIAAIERKDMMALGPLLEQEALEMHAVMLSSQPPARFYAEATEDFLCWLREVRYHHRLPIFFTLDAGPNPHLIGEAWAQAKLHALLKAECPSLTFISDSIGHGPELSLISSEKES